MKQTCQNIEKGSVIMEYVILIVLVAVPIFLFWHGASIEWYGGELSFPGIYDFSTGELKGTGLEIQGFFQRIMSGIALPIP